MLHEVKLKRRTSAAVQEWDVWVSKKAQELHQKDLPSWGQLYAWCLSSIQFWFQKNLAHCWCSGGHGLEWYPKCWVLRSPQSRRKAGDKSIIVIVATDAPFLPHQLKRIVQRVPLGIGILGGRGSNGSGDLFLSFSTANPGPLTVKKPLM